MSNSAYMKMPVSTAQKVLNYLASRPYNEVQPLIAECMQCPVVDPEVEVKEDNANG